jgi:hypothetical protein
MTFVMWLTLLPPSASMTNDYNWRGFTITLTKPDGTTEKLGPFVTDSTASCYTSYTPDQIGNWTAKVDFPGQVYGVGFITPSPYTGVYANDTFSASSYTTKFIVRQEPVPEEVVYPLPTQFWTRPIEGQNEQWYKVASNWFGQSYQWAPAGVQDDYFQMGGIAPNSAHVMWVQPIETGGIVGGTNTSFNGNAFYSGTQYNSRYAGSGTGGNIYPIIMWGRLYYTLPYGNGGTGGGFRMVDLVTGEILRETNKNTEPASSQIGTG